MGISRKARLLALLGAVAAAPAWAGRGTQIDAPVAAGTCYLGATSCAGVNISGSGVFTTAYVYREGIVSLDALLPVDATSADVSSLGSGPWFAVAFDDANRFQVNAYKSIGFDVFPDSWAFNFFAPGSSVLDEFGFPAAPDLQIQLSSGTSFFLDTTNNSGPWDGASAAFGYAASGLVPANALIGFRWDGLVQTVNNADGLLVGPGAGDTDFVTTARIVTPGSFYVDDDGNFVEVPPSYSEPTPFTPRYADVVVPPAVPEPTSWGLLLFGFGALGAALRRRPARRVVSA